MLLNKNLLGSKLSCLVVGICLLISCSNEENQAESFSSDDLISMEEIDEVIEDVSSIISEVYLDEESTVLQKNVLEGKRYLATCAVKTVEKEAGKKKVTIDFGEACELRNGKIVKGKLVLIYAFDKEKRTREITNLFEDFFVNDKQVSGSSSKIHFKGSDGLNPKSTFTEDITIAWESGEKASRVGTRVSEMIEGYGDRDWSNNVYEITGSWTSTSKNGAVHSVEITTGLRKELACRFIVSGTKTVVKGDKVVSLDYGDGSCDSVAVFTSSDGTVKEISLGKRKEKR